MPPECPSDDSLRRLGDEDLEPDVFAELDRHVAGCPNCQARLGRLGRWISTWKSMRGRRPPFLEAFPSLPGFVIEAVLGRGATGVVFLARQEEADRLVALKVLAGGEAHDPDQRARRRWLQEVKAVASGRHPNVVQLYDWDEAGGLLYLVMEYLPGGSLKDSAAEPLNPREAAATMEAVALAVEHINGQGLLHLDLKPSNILLDRAPGPGGGADGPTPKVADFGLSRAYAGDPDGESSVGGPRGTPPYMAPEQVKGVLAELRPTTDVYALGATLYHLLTGRPPFLGASDVETMEQVLRQEPVPPRRLSPRIPADLETIVLKCLEKPQERRYASAAAVAEDLLSWLDGRPIAARPASHAERALRWARRKPGLATALAALAATILVSVASLLFLYRRAVEGRAEADRNFASVSALILEMEVYSLGDFIQRGGDHSKTLDGSLALLRKHIDELRSSRPVDTRILYELGNIDGYLANHLRSVSRYDEARTLMRERIDFLSDCMRKDEASEEYAWVMTRSLYESGVLERETLSYDEALEYLDRAARLILDAPRAGGPRESQAMPLAVEYSRLREEFELSGDGERSARAGRGRRRMLDLILAAESDRPDRVLFKACALADDGDEGRARELVDGLAARDRPFESQPGWVRQTTAEALREWGWREARRFVPRGRDEPEVRPDDPSVDQFLGRFARLCDRFGADARDLNELADGVLDPACRAASRQRQAGRLDLAEKTVAFLSALGAATVRSRPDLPVSHILLAESHEQRSKNAWKRDDVAGVRDELASAVKVVQEALHLAPDDWRLIARLKTYTRKLSGLPPQEGSHLAAGPDGGANPGPSSR